MSEIATLGGGCYWCLEAFYQRIRGIDKVISGYSGGHLDHPTTERVYQGNTGHAEVVQLTFDPRVITYRELLEIFFVMHDPTTPNRQGYDVGDEYRSIILYHSEEQHTTAADMIATFAPTLYKDPVVTELKAFEKFWPADESMQDYYHRNPNAGYCMVVIDPKIQKLRQKFALKLKD
ncbi:MAG TPA: peptide-methionine (S)-S-oxide reductase MsrA [Candidatus Saccharimonadales bacterium]|nr:peptide-methionine (S)-S-oxide reductase MsrA [Candidatus Saccharimonadales bacterium]